jgi:cell division protease FtsH
MFMGRDLNKGGAFSERTMQLVDEEVKRLVTEAQAKARSILAANKKALDQLAQSLFDREVLSGDDVDKILATARA